MKAETVFVGLSGGVDSSTAAYLLKRDGFKVVGVYMKNWSQDIGAHHCPWREDYLAAKSLAAFLEIDFLLFDFEKAYKKVVVGEMLEAYRQGLTPNPDINCNQEIKFKLFFDACRERGADLVATGHYARIDRGRLLRGVDPAKDQSYFLYRIERSVLPRLLFPLGGYLKSQTRALAKRAGLPNAGRSESMGLCFVGQVGLADFLTQYLELLPGPVLDERGREIGRHKGAVLYTIGQRHGLAVGGGLPCYVFAKDVAENTVYVTRDLNHHKLWSDRLRLDRTHWLAEPSRRKVYDLRFRHGGDLFKARLQELDSRQNPAVCVLESPVRAAAAGQSAVLYDRETVIGGGIICQD